MNKKASNTPPHALRMYLSVDINGNLSVWTRSGRFWVYFGGTFELGTSLNVIDSWLEPLFHVKQRLPLAFDAGY